MPSSGIGVTFCSYQVNDRAVGMKANRVLVVVERSLHVVHFNIVEAIPWAKCYGENERSFPTMNSVLLGPT